MLHCLKNKNTYVKCDNSHVLAVNNIDVARRLSSIVSSNNVSSYTTNVKSARQFDAMKESLVHYGVCPDRLQFVRAREVNVIIDKRGTPTSSTFIENMHPYALVSMAMFDNQPVIVAESITDDHEELICLQGFAIEK